MIIIPISGKAQHGKDLCAKLLKEQLELDGKKVLIVHYADYLKYICKEYYGWDGQKNNVGRTLLQMIGTNKARTNNPNIWVNVVKELILAIGEDYDVILIPDTRFQNECDAIKKVFNTTTLRVKRLNFTSSLNDEQLTHPSETSLDNYNFDYYLESNSGELNMKKEVDKFLIFLNKR